MVAPIDLCSTNYSTGLDTENLRQIRGNLDNPQRGNADTLLDTAQASRGTTIPHRKWTRLNDEARVQVVERYSAGETMTVLAEEFGVAKSTVLGILRSNNVIVRHQPMTSEQVGEAARLYESGLSLSQFAEQLKVNQETMWVAIMAADVQLRPP